MIKRLIRITTKIHQKMEPNKFFPTNFQWNNFKSSKTIWPPNPNLVPLEWKNV